MKSIETTCCIVGGGPAGMMLGYLLARAGVDVVVLEKHADFLRDFRGDTVHPSTLQVLDELGLLDRFLVRPHQELRQIKVEIGSEIFQVADFGRLRARCKFLAFTPQWDFLDFLAEEAHALPQFQLLQSTEGSDLIKADGAVTGIYAKGPEGEVEIHASLVVAADGRSSTLRGQAGLEVTTLGATIDVLWFRVGRTDQKVEQTLGRIDSGRFMITIDRGDYWQCAYVIHKGAADALKAQPMATFKQAVIAAAPYLEPRIDDIAGWDDVKLLSVAVDRLDRWSAAGLLCIGDAAHAMSPIGGVGINMAIQDAVATANLLASKLKVGRVSDDDLDGVRRRRLLPTRIMQGFQLFVQNRVLVPTLANATIKVPFIVRLLNRWPVLQALPARFIGFGIRPEHITSR